MAKKTVMVGLIAALGGMLLVVVPGVFIFGSLQRDRPARYDDIAEHFKYGSIGSETVDPNGVRRAGIPYWVWRVLPDVFDDHLPDRPGDGYERFGFIYESAEAPRPIGISYRENPFPSIGLNCAACHTGTLRAGPDADRQIVLGMPAHQFDLQRYLRFLIAVGQDERLNADVLLPAIGAANPDFSWWDSLIYRFFVIPRVREGLAQVAEDFAWFDARPDQGPGRVDTFNPYKGVFNEVARQQNRPPPFDLAADNTIGTADLPSLWKQGPRDGMWLHWDGNNNRVEERNKSAAIGAGAWEDTLDFDAMQRVEDWITALAAPSFPADRIDWSRIETGTRIYRQHCASCHAFDGAAVGQVTPLAEIGTDPARSEQFTETMAQYMNTLGDGRFWDFSHFRDTDGYANMPLDGIWLRAPYLHNGSVPTLRDLLSPPDQRPEVFYRGYDVYDFDDVGFVTSGPQAERWGVRFDTQAPGNGNQGHGYGSALSAGEKQALLAYLKTL